MKEKDRRRRRRIRSRRRRSRVQLVHEILQIKEEQEERMTIVKTKEEDTHKRCVEEMSEQIQKKTRRWRHKKQRPCRKTRIREKKETIVESWRHKKKAKFTLKRKEDTCPKIRIPKKRNCRTSVSSDSDLKSEYLLSRFLNCLIVVSLRLQRIGRPIFVRCQIKLLKIKITWHSPNYIIPDVLSLTKLFRFLTSHVSAFA